MMDEVSSFSKELYDLHSNSEWRKVIKLGEIISLEERKRYLWVWPIEQHMKELKSELDKLGVRSLCSLGCGTGLLEWLMMKCTGLPIKGFEVDEFYWTSQNAPKPFIELEFAKRKITSSFYNNRCTKLEKYGLLFCYFNNPRAFKDYVKYYHGNVIVIIGPSKAVQERVCDPMPEEPEFEDENMWVKCFSQAFGNNGDLVVIYKRKCM